MIVATFTRAIARFATAIFLLSVCSAARAENILSSLDFDGGSKWALIGVPITNYKALPIQRDLGTFITQDIDLMKKLQQDWDLDITFDDNCDAHYLLKFYKDGELALSLKVNLYCGYLDANQLGYQFDPSEFERFRTDTKSISWAKITFGNQTLLQKAIQKMGNAEGIYWYDNSVQSYLYPGYFMAQCPNLPWDADNDSARFRLEVQLEMTTGDSVNYYIEEHLVEVADDLNTKRISYKVHCDQDFSTKATIQNRYMQWRSHWASTDSISIIAIGVDKKRYQEIMRGGE